MSNQPVYPFHNVQPLPLPQLPPDGQQAAHFLQQLQQSTSPEQLQQQLRTALHGLEHQQQQQQQQQQQHH
eukprot:12410209-Karenia_brevis.AAC.1